MTPPECDPEPTSQPLPPSGHKARDLDHRGICRPVVHRPVMPGVDMTAEKHVIRIAGDRERGHQDRCLPPTGRDFGPNTDVTLTYRYRVPNGPPPVGGDRDNGRPGEVRPPRGVGASPHG